MLPSSQVKPTYYVYRDTLRAASTVLIKGGVLIFGLVCTFLYVAGTMHGVLIKGVPL